MNICQLSDRYTYEIELRDGSIHKGVKGLDKDQVVRVSFIPAIELFPRHDIFFYSFKFKKLIMRSFLELNTADKVKNKIFILTTDKFKLHVFFDTGISLITNEDYDLYI